MLSPLSFFMDDHSGGSDPVSILLELDDPDGTVIEVISVNADH